MGLLGFVASQPWAITPEMHDTILDVVARESEPVEAVAAKLGRPLDNTRLAESRDGVAIIPVHGVIARRMNLFHSISGGTSIEVLARDFRAALEDPEVRAILLDVDSPGGQVNGTGEFARMVRDARGVKPVVAYVGGMGASAAYWIASAADEVVASPHATLGSIGVVYSQTDRTAADERRGVKNHVITSRQSPLKRVDAGTESGRAHIEDLTSRVAALFIDAVAENRGVTPDYVESDFGRGGILLGAEAVAAGMADRLGSFEQVLQELASGRHRRATNTQAVPAAPIEVSTMDSTTTGAAADSQAAAPTTNAQANAPTQAAAPGVDMAEFVRMKEQLASLGSSHATERDARIKAEATSFVATHRDKFAPAEHESARASYVQAATDDALHPLSAGSRVANLEAQAKARPRLALLGPGLGGGLPKDAVILGTGDEPKAEGTLPGEFSQPNGRQDVASTLTAEQMAAADPELAAAFRRHRAGAAVAK